MWDSLAKALAAGLQLWSDKEKSKYQEKFIEIKRKRYEEYNKDPSRRSDAVLDNLDFELRVLIDSFAARVGIENPKN